MHSNDPSPRSSLFFFLILKKKNVEYIVSLQDFSISAARQRALRVVARRPGVDSDLLAGVGGGKPRYGVLLGA